MDIDHLLSLETEEALEYMIKNECNFETFSKRLPIHKVIQFLYVISNVAMLDRNDNVVQVLTAVNTDVIIGKIIHVVSYIDEKDYIQTDRFLKSVIQLVSRIFMIMPGTALRTLSLIQAVDQLLKKAIHIVEEVGDSRLSMYHEKREELDELRKNIISFMVQTQRAKDRRKRETIKPPDDFRKIPILPTTNDIFISGHGKPFLRKNLKEGAYDDLDHYLDVQFRLFREDSISQLRNGIMEYIEQKQLLGDKEVGRLQDARLYKHAKLLRSEMTLEGRLHVVQLHEKHAKKIRWESGNRLLYGSLLCLSPDDFQTLWFGVIMESDFVELKSSHTFKVKLSTGVNYVFDRDGISVTIVESTAYFEAYRHVLNCLQKIKPHDFPFQRYIIDCKTDVRPPAYLIKDTNIKFDLYPNIEDVSIDEDSMSYAQKVPYTLARKLLRGNEDKYIFDIQNNNWPSAQSLHLNDSQYDAFKAALTQEFTLIQGPPGTGKTYLGLLIAKALLRNKDIWLKEIEDNDKLRRRNVQQNVLTHRHYPMLVVCFTNHALDQFMEGIIKFMNLDNKEARGRVVRVGGRCSNQIVEKFSLKEIRKGHKTFIDYKGYKEKMEKKYQRLIQIRHMLKDRKGIILRLGSLSSDNSLKDIFESDKNFHKWLGISFEDCLSSLRRYLERDEGSLDSQTALNENHEVSQQKDLPPEEVILVQTEAQIALQDRQVDKDAVYDVEVNNHHVGLDIKGFFDRFILDQGTTLSDRAKKFLKKTAIDFSNKVSETPLISDHAANKIFKKLQQSQSIRREDRWKMYRYWTHKYRENLIIKLQVAEKEFEEVFEHFNKEKQQADTEILKKATVIAMTTSGAARLQNVLEDVTPKIIIVEEAAEVLEAHIVSTLNRSCEHLILIGDHKQLEPKAAVHELALKYNFSLSMFERMIQNGLVFRALQCQHRMRPEISQLVRPIYDKLEDNENVFDYPHVKGIRSDVYFIKHSYPEDYKDEGRSYSNVFEAQYIKRLCRYLIQQNYSTSQITVLTPYSGQMFCIRDLMPRTEFEGVRILILDNFQGEENDIILLSLVRSNTDGKIGFLDKENRVCVALSRAKIGLYVIGNVDMICRFAKRSTLWKRAIKCLSTSQHEQIGHALTLYCENHPDTEFKAKTPEDFDRAPDGGCERPCDFRLGCGHACRYSCHPKDKDHEKYTCLKPCPKSCEMKHKCKKDCHHPSDCKCQVLIEKQLLCGHVNRIECYITPDDVERKIKEQSVARYKFCKHECRKKCNLNHPCTRKCHYPHSCFCDVLVEKEMVCGHFASMKCCKDPNEYKCQTVVMKNLPNCEHSAEMPCYVDPRKHKCEVILTRNLKCGHAVDLKCHVDVKSYLCQDTVTRNLRCGHEAMMKCYEDDDKFKCKEMVETKRRRCDHLCTHECWDKSFDFLNQCKEMVDAKRRNCEHQYKLECHKHIDTSVLRTYRWQIIEKEVGPCRELVLKEWSCHHPPTKIQCYERNTVDCTEVCGKSCDRDHKCTRPCHYPKDCKCTIEVEKLIPTCRHTQTIPCYVSPLAYKCQFEMIKSLPSCQHTVIVSCHQSTETMTCKIMVEKKLPCGHMKSMRCLELAEEQICHVNVERELLCGHIKTIQCSIPFPYTRVSCNEIVEKTLPCGHKIQDKCDRDASKIKCKESITVKNPQCGHHVTLPCHIGQNVLHCDSEETVSLPDCQKKVITTLECGHSFQVPCFKQRKMVCNQVCDQKLFCGHRCDGKCISCFEGNFHFVCEKQCEEILVCGHMCKERSCGSSSLCRLPCQQKCFHTSCEQQCFVPCKPCLKPCSWKCLHYECTKECGEVCDRPRCEVRCSQRIQCGHRCIGYCGEPCPTLCRECDKLRLSKITKRSIKQLHKIVFVQLQECKHVFDGKILDRQLDEMNMNNTYLHCPDCKTAINDHPRYNIILKSQQKLIQHAKLQLFRLAESRISEHFPLLSERENLSDEYLKEFGTFLLLYGERIKSENHTISRKIQKLCDDAQHYLRKMKTRQRPNIQMYVDITLVQRKICAFWQLGILLCKMSSEEEDFESSDDEEIDTDRLKLTPVQGQFIREQEKKIEETLFQTVNFDDSTLEAVNAEVDKAAEVVSQLKAEIKKARRFPQMPFVVDAHKSFWSKCKNGHYFCSLDNNGECQQCHNPKLHDELRVFARRIQDDETGSLIQNFERKLKTKQSVADSAYKQRDRERKLENDKMKNSAKGHAQQKKPSYSDTKTTHPDGRGRMRGDSNQNRIFRGQSHPDGRGGLRGDSHQNRNFRGQSRPDGRGGLRGDSHQNRNFRGQSRPDGRGGMRGDSHQSRNFRGQSHPDGRGGMSGDGHQNRNFRGQSHPDGRRGLRGDSHQNRNFRGKWSGMDNTSVGSYWHDDTQTPHFSPSSSSHRQYRENYRERRSSRGEPDLRGGRDDVDSGDWFNNRQDPFLIPSIGDHRRSNDQLRGFGRGRGRGRRGRGRGPKWN